MTGRHCLSRDYAFPVAGLAFSSNGRRLFSARSGAIHVWAAPDFNESKTIPTVHGEGLVHFLSDRQAFAVLWVEHADGMSFRAVLYDLDSGQAGESVNFPVEYASSAVVNRGKTLVAAARSHEFVYLISFPEAKILRRIHAHPELHDGVNRRINGLAFSPDEAAILSSSGDNSLKQWDLAAGKLVRTFEGSGKGIEGVQFSSDRSLLAVCESHAILVLDPTTWQVLRTIPQSKHIRWPSIAFSPDNEKIAFATTHDMDIKLYSLSTGELAETLSGHTSGISHVCFSPDGATWRLPATTKR